MKYGNLNLHNVNLRITAGLSSQLIKNGIPQVAFAGRSNVGKSSLMNSLLGRKKLARVSSEPGKTITVNYYEVDNKMTLVDLPGYGFARRSKSDVGKWSSLTQGYFEGNSALRLVLQLVDIRVGLTEDDRMMLGYLDYYELPYIIVATKCDKLGRNALNEACRKILEDPALRSHTSIVLYSSLKDLGRDGLWNEILRYSFGEINDSH